MKKFAPLLLVILLATACKKELQTIPVKFTSTTYENLGTFDSLGTPSYLLPRDPVSENLKTYIKSILVEKGDLRNTNNHLLTTAAIPDIVITKSSDVYITFVSQITTSSNALAFYTYPTNNPPASAQDIKKITYIFPSVGQGTRLRAGDKVKIGRFEPGTTIGLALLKNAWNASTSKLDNSAVHYCSTDVLNPEVDPALKKHAVFINYPAEEKLLIGFENTDRTSEQCDHDFNDVVFYATVTQ